MTFLALTLAGGALVVSVAASYAAAPLSTIKASQDSAPEAFDVTILSVKEEKRQARPVAGDPNCAITNLEFTMTAKVDVVHRSASGVQPGRTITLRHGVLRANCPVPGGNFGEIFNGGDRAQAYLRPAGTPDGAFIAADLKKLP